MLNHTGRCVIETSRLTLRPVNLKDASQMYQYLASDSDVTQYLTWLTHTSVEVTKSILKHWGESY